MNQRTILISGAGIAGPAVAFWLNRHGLRSVIVERADTLRLGGQNVDIRGAGRIVAQRMGIENDIKAASTGEKGLRFVDEHNTVKAEFPASTSGVDSFTAELEILRGDLARILYDQTRNNTEYLFDDHITDVREHDDRMTVFFAKGQPRDFDMVIAADGIRSRTRTLVFGSEPEIRELGVYMGYFTIPRIASDNAWWRWYNAPGRRVISLRPDNVGTTRALLSFMSKPRAEARRGVNEQKNLFRQVFADVGWEAPRILAALDESPDFYFESIGQVHAPRWSRGRVALVGDAGYCPSPISGMGTSLALVGSYVLAGEIAKHEDYREAFASYEKIMRPYVREAQNLPPGAPGLAHPNTKLGIAVLRGCARIAAMIQTSGIANKLFTPPAETFGFPDY